MAIRRLEISNIRNIQQASLKDLALVNIFYGVNGSGKTSILEAIHCLSVARSFRSHKLTPLINYQSSACTVFGEVTDVAGGGFNPVGVRRSRTEGAEIKLAGKSLGSAGPLAENLPIQVINSAAFDLLDGSPAIRRKFMDWGVFHVEHRFHSVWKDTYRCLKQRNTLLRHGRISGPEIEGWSTELSRLGDQLDLFRTTYFERFIPVFQACLARLLELEGLQIHYYRGWDKDRSLSDLLSVNLPREGDSGHTLVGPHRADLRLRYQGALAADVLSRGQQKLVVCALRVAQGRLLSELSNKKCVFLVDDLPSELDKGHREALCGLLEELESQVFVTCVDRQDLLACWSEETSIKLFHVEQGKVAAQSGIGPT